MKFLLLKLNVKFEQKTGENNDCEKIEENGEYENQVKEKVEENVKEEKKFLKKREVCVG